MKPLFVAEWAFALGVITYREVKKGRPPMPGMLLSVSLLFIGLAVLADTGPDQAKLAATVGAGLDVAAFLHLFDNPPAGKPAAAPGVGASVKQTLQQNMPKAGA